MPRSQEGIRIRRHATGSAARRGSGGALRELTFLQGPSGSGKTTLLGIIAGLLHHDGGNVQVLGHDLAKLRNGAAAVFRLRNIGFVFQQFILMPALTAAENAAVPLLAASWKKKDAIKGAHELLEDLGIGRCADGLPNKLSCGEQQKVTFVRALIQTPRLMICDEPPSALDGSTVRHVMELLRKVAVSRDTAVLIVTHDFRILDFADRIAEISDGRIQKVTQREGSR